MTLEASHENETTGQMILFDVAPLAVLHAPEAGSALAPEVTLSSSELLDLDIEMHAREDERCAELGRIVLQQFNDRGATTTPRSLSWAERFRSGLQERASSNLASRTARWNNVVGEPVIKVVGEPEIKESDTMGLRTRADSIRRTREAKAAFSRGEISAFQLRERKQDIKATPRAYETIPQRRSRRMLAVAGGIANVLSSQPVVQEPGTGGPELTDGRATSHEQLFLPMEIPMVFDQAKMDEVSASFRKVEDSQRRSRRGGNHSESEYGARQGQPGEKYILGINETQGFKIEVLERLAKDIKAEVSSRIGEAYRLRDEKLTSPTTEKLSQKIRHGILDDVYEEYVDHLFEDREDATFEEKQRMRETLWKIRRNQDAAQKRSA